MNVSLSSRHVVHATREGLTGPACHAFGAPHGSESYRVTTREVTCKKCLKILAEVETTETPRYLVRQVSYGAEIMWTPDGRNLYTTRAKAEYAAKCLESQGQHRLDDRRLRSEMVDGKLMWTWDGVGYYSFFDRAMAAESEPRRARRNRVLHGFGR